MKIELPGLLFILFLALKLCDVIAWSWFYVTMPLWLPLAIALCFMTFVLAMHFITGQHRRGRLK